MYIFRSLKIVNVNVRIFSLSIVDTVTVTHFKKFCADHNIFISRNIIENFVINVVSFVYFKVKVITLYENRYRSLYICQVIFGSIRLSIEYYRKSILLNTQLQNNSIIFKNRIHKVHEINFQIYIRCYQVSHKDEAMNSLFRLVST